MGRLPLRRPRLVVAASAVFAVLAVLVGGPVAGLLKTGRDNFEDKSSESARAQAALTKASGRSPEADIVVFVRTRRGRSGEAAVRRAERALARHPDIAATVSPLTAPRSGLRSDDGRAALIVGFLRPMETGDAQDASVEIAEGLEPLAGVEVGGPVLTTAQIRDQVSEDLRRAELLAFPLLFLLSLVIFRGLVAALLPVLVGALAVLGTLLMLRIATEFADLSIFALNLVTALGLGLAIDYSLFVLARFREEAVHHGHGREALERTLATAGRTVLFSSLTVALALSALLVFPQPFLFSMAIGGALVALVAGAAAVIALPAVLLLLGPRVDALALRRAKAPGTSLSARLGSMVTRRPGTAAALAAGVLVLAGLPFLGINFTGFDATILPSDASSRQVADNITAAFPGDRTSPVIVTVRGGPRVAAEARQQLAALPGVRAVAQPAKVGDGLMRVDVFARAAPLHPSTQRLVDDTRAALDGLPAEVTGQAARFRDSQHALGARLPYALAILTVTTLAVLFVMTGSALVPFCALAMNLLTVSAAFGILVLTFQDGRLEELLAYTSQGALDASQMVLLFVLVFALSTDYGVFVLGRIKEARDSGLPPRPAIVAGMDATGPLVTAAAVLFCVAIGAFATSQIVFIKEVGIGTAVAVLIDATLVRAVLLPALLALLGDRAWWAPRTLRRLHGRIGLREGPAAAGPDPARSRRLVESRRRRPRSLVSRAASARRQAGRRNDVSEHVGVLQSPAEPMCAGTFCCERHVRPRVVGRRPPRTKTRAIRGGQRPIPLGGRCVAYNSKAAGLVVADDHHQRSPVATRKGERLTNSGIQVTACLDHQLRVVAVSHIVDCFLLDQQEESLSVGRERPERYASHHGQRDARPVAAPAAFGRRGEHAPLVEQAEEATPRPDALELTSGADEAVAELARAHQQRRRPHATAAAEHDGGPGLVDVLASYLRFLGPVRGACGEGRRGRVRDVRRRHQARRLASPSGQIEEARHRRTRPIDADRPVAGLDARGERCGARSRVRHQALGVRGAHQPAVAEAVHREAPRAANCCFPDQPTLLCA